MNNYNGQVYHVAGFPRALSKEEIAQLYCLTPTKVTILQLKVENSKLAKHNAQLVQCNAELQLALAEERQRYRKLVESIQVIRGL